MKRYPEASELNYEMRKYGLKRGLDFGREMADNVVKVDLSKMRDYRVQRAKEQMEKDGFGAMIMYEPWNIRYTTGFNVLVYARFEPRFYALLPKNADHAYLWGMGANGEKGVNNVLVIIRDGISETLYGLGKSSIHQLTPDDLVIPADFTRSGKKH